ncbi:uncharacterized protein LOC142322680 [Lycorma delicatula]|uniref:uncharacterized protein LOC142322680 n=1 Tax=Lycorma delicatula TaxID=130591 RepID=UPI003F517DF4
MLVSETRFTDKHFAKFNGITIFAGSLYLLWPLPEAEAIERLIVDTDAGVDDALAILAVLGDVRYGHLIEGITCVRGNTEVHNVGINVLKTLKIAGRLEIPVYPGAETGLINSPDTVKPYGEDGFGNVNYPEAPPLTLLQNKHAAIYLSSIVQKYPGEVTILMLGPMTNVALALRINPDFMSQVKRIVSIGGNVKATGTYRPNLDDNFYMDPHAATIVFQGIAKRERKITLVSMESITENLINLDWRIFKMGKINSTKIDFINRIEKISSSPVKYWKSHDLYAATVLMKPESIIDSKEFYVDVENEGRLTRGVIVVDYNNILKQPPNADIIFSIDKNAVMNISLQNFK